MSSDQFSDKLIVEAIRNKGFKATPQRIAICRIALNDRDHPTAQNIYDKVQKEHPTVSLATVYKTLQMLEELNLISEICLSSGQTRYDPLMYSHINLICTQCGRIEDIEDSRTQNIMENIASAAKFTMTAQPISVYGICANCRKNQD
jgi:Fur family peroxide stress response transcriptional regulator